MSASNTGTSKRGIDLLHDPRINKSTGFTEAERQALGLVGLVPDVTESIETQLTPCLAAAQGEGHRPRPVHLPDESARDERDALLSHPDVGPGPLPRDCVRPDDRRGLPEVRPHLPPPARDVSVDQPQGARQGGAAQLAGQRRARSSA